MTIGMLRAALVWIGIGLAAAAHAQSPLSEQVSQRLAEIEGRAARSLADSELKVKLLTELDALLAAMAAGGSSRDESTLVDVAAARRIAELAGAAPAGERAGWWDYLSGDAGPGRTLAFALSEADNAAGVLRVLQGLRERFGDEKVARYPALVAALCVVHDGEQPFARRINENTATSAGPVALFEYYTSNERQMLFGLRTVPPELLVFVVDAAASIDELQWALDEHRGDRAVGERFFDITYDYAHANTGRPKAVSEQGFTLPNIARLGGVCADQCHYAVTIGKAIGVPTAYVTGRGGEVGHAWVGYLEAKGRGAAWNFDVGRYEEYQGVRGDLLDPQTMRTIGDDELGLLAKLTTVNERQRFAAAAWLDAAVALKDGVRPVEIDTPRRGAERSGREGVLDLAELALRQNPADRRGWALVREAVADPAMTTGERVRWSQVIIRLCEDANAEHFMVGVLEPMIASMDSSLDRIGAWERVLDHVKTKKDLRARIRMLQAGDAIERGDQHGAYLAYQDVIDNSLNDTRMSRYAVAGAVKMLEDAGKHREAAQLLGDVLKRVDRPTEAAAFSSSSNYNAIRALAEAYSARHGVAVAGL
jgi:hypothetical protein